MQALRNIYHSSDIATWNFTFVLNTPTLLRIKLKLPIYSKSLFNIMNLNPLWLHLSLFTTKPNLPNRTICAINTAISPNHYP